MRHDDIVNQFYSCALGVWEEGDRSNAMQSRMSNTTAGIRTYSIFNGLLHLLVSVSSLFRVAIANWPLPFILIYEMKYVWLFRISKMVRLRRRMSLVPGPL